MFEAQNFQVGKLLSDIPDPPPGTIIVPFSAFNVSPTGGAANTKGSWSSCVDPIPKDITGIVFSHYEFTANRDFLFDFAIGPSGGGSESVIIPDIHYSFIPAGVSGCWYSFPLYLPHSAGLRLSVRTQCNIAAGQTGLKGYLQTRTRLPRYRSVETYGANTADSGGTSIDPGASINTKGAYSTLGTTTNRIKEIALSVGNQLNTVRSAYFWQFDLAIGAGPTILMADQRLDASSTNDMMFPQWIGPFECDIPPGTDIKVRAQCNGNDATDRLFDIVAYGFSESK